jgi:regulatory protein
MESEISFLEAKAKLETLCAYQEKCQFDIELKLTDWCFDKEQKDQLISHLISFNFINEERFAYSYVSGKFRIKKWGRLKITSHLKQKRISNYSIQKGLKEIDSEAYWNTLELLAKKKRDEIQSKKENDWVKKGKIYRFLISKGYESELINEVLSAIQL